MQCRSHRDLPLGVLIVPWKTEPPYHDGPGSISTLLPCDFTKSAPKICSVDIVLLAIIVSSILAARTHLGSVAFTEIVLAPVTSFAGH